MEKNEKPLEGIKSMAIFVTGKNQSILKYMKGKIVTKMIISRRMDRECNFFITDEFKENGSIRE
jgi:hypothetical protein